MSINKIKKEGIYFNLSNEDYHNDLAVSCSGVKLLLQNPLKYWWQSPMNPKKKKLDTHALRLGRLYHTLLLEPEKFKGEFLVLAKGEMIKSFLKKRGLEKEDIDHFTIIREPDTQAAQAAVNEIKADTYYDSWFKGGYPEVSIFWRNEESGLMCRARFDYLHQDFCIDYKTTENIGVIEKSIANYHYSMQGAIYLDGLQNIYLKLINDENIEFDGTDEQKEWFKNISNNLEFRLLFQEKKEPFVTADIILECESDKTKPSLINEARKPFLNGLEIYKRNFEKYGKEKWKQEHNLRVIGYNDLPMWYQYWLADGGINQSEEIGL